jgi:hypothetical protein
VTYAAPSTAAATNSRNATPPDSSPWLFSRNADLWSFGGSTALALALVLLGAAAGWLDNDSPEWTWVGSILLVDVAHVWATGFRVYFAPAELKRRPWLYGLTPALAWLLGASVYSESESAFWRCMAYLAVFHFVRQQAGWVAIYRAKSGDRTHTTRWVDTLAIYSATVWPLIWWHGQLPRAFWWFRSHDFVAIPNWVGTATAPLYAAFLAAYLLRSLQLGLMQRRWNPGKDLVVASTAVCWFLGIVALNSDYAFMVTNVLIHGIPYLVLVHRFQTHARSGDSNTAAHDSPPCVDARAPNRRSLFAQWYWFLATVWCLAYFEEFLWDRGVWHERAWLFGAAWQLDLRVWLVPQLAVPQLTHYLLDGAIWRRKSNPSVGKFLAGR